MPTSKSNFDQLADGARAELARILRVAEIPAAAVEDIASAIDRLIDVRIAAACHSIANKNLAVSHP